MQDLFAVDRIPIRDQRGFFSRFFCADELASLGLKTIAQVNHTRTEMKGTVRGMHFQQEPHAEKKYISCLRGAVFDVAVDLRSDSPTYLQWHGEVLSEDNARSLLIPAGFAHGFQTLTDGCEMMYLHDVPHAPMAEGGVHPLDPKINIAWPLPIEQLSPRDEAFRFM